MNDSSLYELERTNQKRDSVLKTPVVHVLGVSGGLHVKLVVCMRTCVFVSVILYVLFVFPYLLIASCTRRLILQIM